MSERYTTVVRPLLWALALLATLRLGLFTLKIVESSLQMDFSVYYTAGRTAAAGLDPYRNYAPQLPELWDGVNPFQHARFQYPPLVATLFVPLARLPYHAAKTIWTLMSVACLVASFVLTVRICRPVSRDARLFGAALWLYSFPLLTQIERGQIDLVTLVLLLGGIECITRPSRRAQLQGGALFALTCLIKPNALLLAPFLLLRKRWSAAVSFAVGLIVLGSLNLAVNGRARSANYIENVLPRILAYADGGPPSSRLPGSTLDRLHAGIPEARARRDGVEYGHALFSFNTNASLARSDLGRSLFLTHNRRLRAAIILAVFLGAIAFMKPWRPDGDRTKVAELTYWQAAMGVMLLASPVTWVMTAVWLLPASFVLMIATVQSRSRARLAWTMTGIAGFLILNLPDVLVPWFLEERSVIGEAILVVALVALMRKGGIGPMRGSTTGVQALGTDS